MARPDTRSKPHPKSPVQPPAVSRGAWLALVVAIVFMAWSVRQYFFDDLTSPERQAEDGSGSAEPIAISSSTTIPTPPKDVSGAVRARANLASYVSNDDYPQDALNREEQGTVGFRLEVDQAGKVSRCIVTASSGSFSLDSATCRIMTARARFSPAINDLGQPVRDSVNSRIRWQLAE
jgi:TonB family protein